MIPTARFGNSDRMTAMQKYTNPLAAGYLLEADACRKVLKDLQRSADKYKRKVEKERADRRQEFETVMGYRSEADICSFWQSRHSNRADTAPRRT